MFVPNLVQIGRAAADKIWREKKSKPTEKHNTTQNFEKLHFCKNGNIKRHKSHSCQMRNKIIANDRLTDRFKIMHVKVGQFCRMVKQND